ncbi:hypothetical protein L195_g026656, partial [Trifolium pratense]
MLRLNDGCDDGGLSGRYSAVK